MFRHACRQPFARCCVALCCLTFCAGITACSTSADESLERRPTLDVESDLSLDAGGVEPSDGLSPDVDAAGTTDALAQDTSSTDGSASDVEPGDTTTEDAADAALADADAVDATDEPPEDVGPAEDAAPDDVSDELELYQGTSNPFEFGPLRYSSGTVDEGREGAPVSFLLLVPLGDGPYPVVVFQHGFLLANSYYSQLLGHVASHGFVVVAPQMYPASIIPIGQPTAAEETALASSFYTWLDRNLVALGGPSIEPSVIGLAGHSRGGKVIWGLLQDYDNQVSAVAGVDPVDGTGGPLGGQARVISGPLDLGIPSLVIGTGLGPEGGFTSPACAPEGDNHVQFYEASASPAWHVVATDYGHNDMLDDDPAGCFVTCTACGAGPSRAPMRATTAGALVAFFRATLQGVDSAVAVLEDASGMPVPVVLERR